jgi:hypothetical protein
MYWYLYLVTVAPPKINSWHTIPCKLKPTLPFISSDVARNSGLLVKMMTSIRMTVYFGDHITDTAKCTEEHV